MPNTKTFVTYNATTGAIRNVYRAPAEDAPGVPDGHDLLKLNPNDPAPKPLTHKVDLGPPVTVVERSLDDQIAEAQATRKAVIEEALGSLDTTRAAMDLRGFDLVAIDQRISDLEAEHASLP